RARPRTLELVEGELRAFVPRVESLRAEVDGVRAVRDGGPDGIERAGRGEELRDGTRRLHRPKDSASARRAALRRLVRRSFLEETQQERDDDEGNADPPHHVVLAANA